MVDLSPAQRRAAESQSPITLVLGSAGTGKTTTAIAAAHRALAREGVLRHQRALFLTFSRTAVAQIEDRLASAEGAAPFADRLEVATFHSFAFQMLRAFGDLADTKPISKAQHDLFGQQSDEITYGELVPGAVALLSRKSLERLLCRRWVVVVCDEFQDTNDSQWELLQRIGKWSRLLLMADPNQTIYDRLPGNTSHRMGQQRINDVMPNANVVELAAGSYRDPTNVLPAAAEDARRRSFASDAVRHAVRLGRLQVRQYSGEPEDHYNETFEEVRSLAASGALSVGIFLHGTDAVARLSARFAEEGVEHVVAGLGESHAEAMRALSDLVGFATGHVEHASLRHQLAVYAAATRRNTPEVAHMLAGTRPFESTALEQRLVELEQRLIRPMGLTQLVSAVSGFWPTLGIAVGQTEWRRAAGTFSVLARTSLPASSRWRQEVPRLRVAAEQAAGDSLFSASRESIAPIRLMNFHQTKGREADATVLVFTSGDFFGRERSPYPAASRLLYVAMTRARHNVRVLLPRRPHTLVAPLRQYCQ